MTTMTSHRRDLAAKAAKLMVVVYAIWYTVDRPKGCRAGDGAVVVRSSVAIFLYTADLRCVWPAHPIHRRAADGTAVCRDGDCAFRFRRLVRRAGRRVDRCRETGSAICWASPPPRHGRHDANNTLLTPRGDAGASDAAVPAGRGVSRRFWVRPPTPERPKWSRARCWRRASASKSCSSSCSAFRPNSYCCGPISR